MKRLTLKIRRVFSVLFLVLSVSAVLLISGCAGFGDFTKVATSLAVDAGYINQDQKLASDSAGESLEKAGQTFSPEEEYHLGRSVAANLMAIYPPLGNDRADEYLNTLGQALAMASGGPQTYGGEYRFILLDSEDINAFAAPGSFILVTKGMLRCASDEARLAAVLAHEIGHAQLNHGVQSIYNSRKTEAGTKGVIALGSLINSDIAEYQDSFNLVIGEFTQTLFVKGYSRKYEKEADEAAAVILARVGYDPESIVLMLQEMKKRWKPGTQGFAATHPSPDKRIRKVRKTVDSLPEPKVKTTPIRVERYKQAFSGIL